MSPCGKLAVHARRFVRMFMATTLPCAFCAGLPGWADRPSIWKKFPSGFNCFDSLTGSAFQAAELSFEQTYMYPVRGLKLDGGQSTPPRAAGANAVYCRWLYGVKMQPTFTFLPSGAFQLFQAFGAHCAAKGWPTGTGCVGHVCWTGDCGTLRSGMPRIGLPLR